MFSSLCLNTTNDYNLGQSFYYYYIKYMDKLCIKQVSNIILIFLKKMIMIK